MQRVDLGFAALVIDNRENRAILNMKKFLEGFLAMSGQQADPGCRHSIIITMRGAMMGGEALDPCPDVGQRDIERLAAQVQPGQTQMVGVPEFGIFEPAGVERFQELVVGKMSGRKRQRHNAIMTGLPGQYRAQQRAQPVPGNLHADTDEDE